MGSQFVDLDADGHLDIVSATFDGSPHVSYGSEDGFAEPVRLRDAAGERLLIGYYWDYDERKHLRTGRALASGEAESLRCISALAFDWDGDGDHDLLLGSYEEGRLFRQMNEGTNAEPRFTGRNVAVEAGGEPIALDGKLTTPKLVDWDGDGDQDLVLGTFKGSSRGGGGVYLALNEGGSGAPSFASLVPLIETPSASGIEPTGPNEGLYPDPVDWDGDGDLDLVVGAYSIWTPEERTLSEAESARLTAVEERRTKLRSELRSTDDDARLRAVAAELAAVDEEFDGLQTERQRRGFIWLYERLSPGEERADQSAALEPTEDRPLAAAFALEPGEGTRHRAVVRVAILDGWHAYDAGGDSPYAPLEVELVLSDGARQVGAWERPSPTSRTGEWQLPSFEGEVAFSCDVELGNATDRGDVGAVVRYQLCNADYCLPAQELRLAPAVP